MHVTGTFFVVEFNFFLTVTNEKLYHNMQISQFFLQMP